MQGSPWCFFMLGMPCAVGYTTPALAVEATETIERTFTVEPADGHRTVRVENVLGAIGVTAGKGDEIRLTLVQSWKGADTDELAKAREAVKLEVKQERGWLELKQGGRWRSGEKCRGSWGDECDHESMDVHFDWMLVVPEDVNLALSNVNGGDIRVSGGNGRLEVKHVNDDVTIDRYAGGVDAFTVNGTLTATFHAVPRDAMTFGTVNGPIDLSFPKRFGAELIVQTVNGEVLTDFPFTLPIGEDDASGRLERWFGLGERTRVSIGEGGVPLSCKTVNGDITLRAKAD